MGKVRKKCDWCAEFYQEIQNDFSVKHSAIGWAAGMQDKHNFCSKRCKHDFDGSNSSQPVREEHSEYNYESNNSDDEGVTFGDVGVFIKRMIVVLGLLWLLYSYLSK